MRPHRVELLVDGRAVSIGRRAFDILMMLVDARGDLVAKDQILDHVWAGRVVEENTVQVHISSLRKVLGKDAPSLKTVSGRGYRLVAEIYRDHVAAEERDASSGKAADGLGNLPVPTGELIGRDAEVADIIELAATHRVVSLIGPGGIGKTRLCLAAARQLLHRYADGVWIAELAPLSDPDLVPVALATALGLSLATGAWSAARVAMATGSKQILVVLDNCEHVIDAAARMTESLLAANPLARVLVTAQEPLRIPGEAVYRVRSLKVPASGGAQSDLLEAGAVKLFIARARAAAPHFKLDAVSVDVIGTICRRLDGIPLAIELAAARAASLGVEALERRLDERFKLLTGGHRTALPRQQTLRAALDWSYELLTASERMVLHRLSIFAGAFPLEAATAVVPDAGISATEVLDCVANLAAKSFLSARSGTMHPRYRLLETTRLYAREKLAECGDVEEIARRHAEHYCNELNEAAGEWGASRTPERRSSLQSDVDNVRAALQWAFSPQGDRAIAIALTLASVPLWFRVCLMEECRGRVEQALAAFASDGQTGSRVEVQLQAALALSWFYTNGATAQSLAAWSNALALAEQLEQPDYRLHALWGLWACRLTGGEFQHAQSLAQRYRALAARDGHPEELAIGERMTAHVLHYLGAQSTARAQLERMIDRDIAPQPRSQTYRFLLHPRSSTRTMLAQILWLQGRPDSAVREAQLSVQEAQSTGHALSVCYALALAQCPIALAIGDLDALEESIGIVLAHSARHSLPYWHAWVRCFQGVLRARRGQGAEGIRLLRAALKDLQEAGFGRGITLLLACLGEALADDGEIAGALATIDDGLDRAKRCGERWWLAELLRIRGEIVLRRSTAAGTAASERHFLEALACAREQEALSLELRSASSLARLWRGQGFTERAYDLLSAVYDRFTEGFQTADLRAAAVLLDTMRLELGEIV